MVIRQEILDIGTYEFYDCCNLEHEITRIANETGIKSTAGTIEELLKNQAPIVIGYSGWEDDVIMSKTESKEERVVLPAEDVLLIANF